MILSLAAVILTFGLVIFLHEAGHFILCKRLGVRVQRFAFGFGPELIGVTHDGTRFSICAVPLGGFVKPAGESLEDCTGQPDEYFSKTPWERLLIVAAGPVMNYVLAFLMFFGVVWHKGSPEPSKEAVLGELAAGYPAEKAGLKAGDRVVGVDSVAVSDWDSMAEIVHRSGGKEIEISYLREGTPAKARMTPKYEAASGHGLIGVVPKIDYRKVGFAGAAKGAALQCWGLTAYTVRTLVGTIKAGKKPDLAGPVGIIQMVSKAAHSSLEDFVFLIGLISVAIGFFNLLPVPLLDGGHAVLYLWEGLSRRKLTTKVVAAVNSAGLVFLMSLLLFATYNDILRIREQRREKRQAAAESSPAK